MWWLLVKVTNLWELDVDAAKSIEDSVINIELKPLAQPPKFASLLRVAFVKIPECGILNSIKPISEVEYKERQDMIDLALQKYFEVDRYLSCRLWERDCC